MTVLNRKMRRRSEKLTPAQAEELADAVLERIVNKAADGAMMLPDMQPDVDVDDDGAGEGCTGPTAYSAAKVRLVAARAAALAALAVKELT